MSIDNIREKLKALRLAGALAHLDTRLQEAAANSLSHSDFLELLLQDELLNRSNNRLQSALRQAGFRNLKSFSSFDWQFNTNLEKREFMTLATGDFLKNATNVLFIGPSGTGKTHLAQAIGYELLKMGKMVIYRSIFDIVAGLQGYNAISDRNLEFNRYMKADLLIIDDMGLRQLPEKAGELLFEIIFRRHELKSILMTSNRPLEDWGKMIRDVPTAGAILDRFLQESKVIIFKGRSYRLSGKKGENGAELPVW